MNSHYKTWQIDLQRIADRALGQPLGQSLWQKYHSAFPDEYPTLVTPRYALKDILNLEQLAHSTRQLVSLLKPGKNIEHYRLHFYSQQPRYLDEYIPVLENLHLRVMDQVQFQIIVNGNTLFIKSFTIKAAKSQCTSFALLRCRLLETLQIMMDDKVENDALNKLCVLTGMAWHDIDVLRAYRNYYLQLDRKSVV